MLAGVPVLFLHSSRLGYFLTSEWQVEGPINFLYHSAAGEIWTSVDLPEAERKDPDGNCCYVASIRRLCVDEAGSVFVAYQESDQFYGGAWSAKVDESFPENVNWAQVPVVPDNANCDVVAPSDFVPRSLLKKSRDGALFEVSAEWAVRIPGPIK